MSFRNIFYKLSFLVIVVLTQSHIWALEKGFVLAPSDIREVMKRSDSSANDVSLEGQLVYCFKVVAALAGKKAYEKYLHEHWNAQYEPQQKKEILEKAELAAQMAAADKVKYWLELKSNSGKKMSPRQLVGRMYPTDFASINFFEEDQFFTEQGKLNLKSHYFTSDNSNPLNSRQDRDLISFADKNFPGTPEERRRKAIEFEKIREAEREKLQSEIAKKIQECNYPRSYDSIRACGTPGAHAATLNPEFNGMPR